MRSLVLLAVTACGGSLGSGRGVSVERVTFPDGKPRFEFDLRGGLPNGHGRAWFPNGKLAFEGEYRNGGRHGQFVFFTDDGAFAYQAIFFSNAEVWRSTERNARPPADWLAGLEESAMQPVVDGDMAESAARHASPHPMFATLDRTTFSRVGVQLGVGATDERAFGDVARLDVFAHLRHGRYGAYVQASETVMTVANYTSALGGRRLGEAGGTLHLDLPRAGALFVRAGLLVPAANNDLSGFVVSSAGAAQRPTDAVGSIPSAMTLRTGASLVRTIRFATVQVDGGLDWLVAADDRDLDALAHLNGAVALGTGSAMFMVELNTAGRVMGPPRTIASLAIGGSFTYQAFDASVSFVLGTDALALLTTVSHAL